MTLANAQDNPQLAKLTATFPKALVKPAPKGKYGDFIPHYVIEQRIISVVGPFSWELVEVLRNKNDLITAAVYRMTLTIDGREVRIEEPGDADNYNKEDGFRLKVASSDAMKRCGMRLGIGTHLWCQNTNEWFLRQALGKSVDGSTVEAVNEVAIGGGDDEPEAAPTLSVSDDDWAEYQEIVKELDAKRKAAIKEWWVANGVGNYPVRSIEADLFKAFREFIGLEYAQQALSLTEAS